MTVGSDFLGLDPRPVPRGARTVWLVEQLRDAVADGRLPVGARLPASRVLAGDLGLSRGVVTEVYRRLADDGVVAGRGRAGTVVLDTLTVRSVAQVDGRGLGDGGRRAGRRAGDGSGLRAGGGAGRAAGRVAGGGAGRAAGHAEPDAPAMVLGHRRDPAEVRFERRGAEVFDALRAAPARIDLTPGVPDLGAFPRADWLRAERVVLRDAPTDALGYGDPRGAPALRAEVAGWLARYRGLRVDPAEVLVVAGVAQALALLAQVLAARGVRELAVEDPGSLGARRQMEAWGMPVAPVPVDADGLAVDRLAAGSAGVVLVTPAHQFPTGVVLSGPRRRALAAWLQAGGLAIEDDYDAEHRYDRAPVPALHALAPDRVCYTGSVSKVLAPAMRLGWLVAPADLRDDLVAAKRATDLGNAVLPQLVLAELMRSGGLERHLRAVRRRHRTRRDAMVAAVARHLPGARVHGAAAGLHLTVTLPAGVDDVAVATAALDAGVKVHPLFWHRVRPGAPGLVLGYAARPATDIEEGVAVLGRCVAGLARRGGGAPTGRR
ncbi:MAG: PLP-dependent aminotransferase family protein [Dermatophilaceae bacterium]